MIVRAAGWLYRKLGGSRYFLAYLAFEVSTALLIALGTVGIFSLYQSITDAQFRVLVGFSWVCVLVALFAGVKKIRRSSRPLLDWIQRGRTERGAAEAWRAAVGLPLEFVTRQWWQPIVFLIVPVSIFFPVYLGLPPISVLVVAARLPRGFSGEGVGAPLRWKLLGSLPMINVITGVIVSGLSAHDRGQLSQLGLDVAAAVVVAFTISLELTLLVTRSVLSPVHDLMVVTERVRAGDLSARAPVVSGDEMGVLA